MSAHTFTEADIPMMRERTKVPDLTYKRLSFDPQNEFVDKPLRISFNKKLADIDEVESKFKFAFLK